MFETRFDWRYRPVLEAESTNRASKASICMRARGALLLGRPPRAEKIGGPTRVGLRPYMAAPSWVDEIARLGISEGIEKTAQTHPARSWARKPPWPLARQEHARV